MNECMNECMNEGMNDTGVAVCLTLIKTADGKVSDRITKN